MIYVLPPYFLVLQISEDDFQNVLDRVATSKDFAIVRDNILFFLQVRPLLLPL